MSAYAGGWTCIDCGHTSPNEHDPCSCDDDTSKLIEDIYGLRRQLKYERAKLAKYKRVVEAARKWRENEEIDALPDPDRVPAKLRRLEWQTLDGLRNAIDALDAEDGQ